MAKTFMETCPNRAVSMAWASVRYSLATLSALAEGDAEEVKKAVPELVREDILQDRLFCAAIMSELKETSVFEAKTQPKQSAVILADYEQRYVEYLREHEGEVHSKGNQGRKYYSTIRREFEAAEGQDRLGRGMSRDMVIADAILRRMGIITLHNEDGIVLDPTCEGDRLVEAYHTFNGVEEENRG